MGRATGHGADAHARLPKTARGRAVAEDIRRWLARELHDDVIAALTPVLVDMEDLRRNLPESATRDRLLAYQGSLRAALGSLRRLLTELRDQPGVDDRLVDDAAALLDHLKGRSGIKGTLSVSPTWPRTLSAHIAINMRRIMEEALRNVALHSAAKHVEVSLEADQERLTLTVTDDGRGCHWLGAAPRTGAGLLGMEERALILGGQLEVTSLPGAGTTVRGTFSPACT